MALCVASAPAFVPAVSQSRTGSERFLWDNHTCIHSLVLVDRTTLLDNGLRRLFHRTAKLCPARGESVLPVKALASGPGGQGQTKYGLGGPGTWFGFGRNQERQVGRLAMVGFMAGVVMEVLTGKGVLGQLGIDPLVVRYPFLTGFTFLLVGGLLGGYVVINNPPDESKAPPNEGDGLPRDPLKTYDPQSLDRLTTWTRGGIVSRSSGQKGREPYVSDLDVPRQKED